MLFEPVYFILAVIISLIFGIVIWLWHRPKLSITHFIIAVVGSILSVYYILNVVFGSGRTGWP